jgi:hypothetical protein
MDIVPVGSADQKAHHVGKGLVALGLLVLAVTNIIRWGLQIPSVWFGGGSNGQS